MLPQLSFLPTMENETLGWILSMQGIWHNTVKNNTSCWRAVYLLKIKSYTYRIYILWSKSKIQWIFKTKCGLKKRLILVMGFPSHSPLMLQSLDGKVKVTKPSLHWGCVLWLLPPPGPGFWSTLKRKHHDWLQILHNQWKGINLWIKGWMQQWKGRKEEGGCEERNCCYGCGEGC